MLETLGLGSDGKIIKNALKVWWQNNRSKEKASWRLTTEGYEALVKAGIKDYKIKFEENVQFTNQDIINLDQQLDCPFYVTVRDIYVFEERTAIQLVLFSGNVLKYASIKSKSH